MQIQNFRKGSMVEKLQRIILYLFVILLPFLVTSLLLHFVIKTDIFQYQPVWTDEVDYWVQINAFKDVGFNSGYFSINELTSKSEFSHYGTHGPMFPILYGYIGRVFGWVKNSAPLFNLALISISLALFLWITNPNIKQTFLVLVFLLFFYQLYLYIPTLMQESLNIGFAILFIALFIRLIIYNDDRLRIKIGIVIVILVASLFRIIWVFTIFPILFDFFKNAKQVRWKLIGPLILGGVFSFVVAVIYWYWTSPYPSGSLFQLTQGALNLRQMVRIEFDLIFSNLRKLIGINLREHDTEIYVRYLYLCVVFVLVSRIKHNKRFTLSLLFILIITLMTTILIYDIGNFRILAPFLLATFFAVVFSNDRISIKYITIFYILISLLTLSNFFGNYKFLHTKHFLKVETPSELQVEIDLSQLKYLITSNPWCNSILTTRVFSPELMSIPAGMGLNVVYFLPEDKLDIKSHYLLVPYDFLAINGIVSTCKTIDTYSEDFLCQRTNDNCN